MPRWKRRSNSHRPKRSIRCAKRPVLCVNRPPNFSGRASPPSAVCSGRRTKAGRRNFSVAPWPRGSPWAMPPRSSPRRQAWICCGRKIGRKATRAGLLISRRGWPRFPPNGSRRSDRFSSTRNARRSPARFWALWADRWSSCNKARANSSREHSDRSSPWPCPSMEQCLLHPCCRLPRSRLSFRGWPSLLRCAIARLWPLVGRS